MTEVMDDEHLEAIRARMRGPFAMKDADRWGVQATGDRLDLVAEVDRLRAELERLRIRLTTANWLY